MRPCAKTTRRALTLFFICVYCSIGLIPRAAQSQTFEPIVRGFVEPNVQVVFGPAGQRTLVSTYFEESRGVRTALAVGKWPYLDYVPIAVPENFRIESISRDSNGTIWAIDGQLRALTWTAARGWLPITAPGVKQFAHTSDGFTLGVDDSGVVRGTPDAGSWTRTSTDGAKGQIAATKTKASVFFELGDHLFALRSDDSGRTWIRSNPFPISVTEGRGTDSSNSAIDSDGNIFVFHWESKKHFILRNDSVRWDELQIPNSIQSASRAFISASGVAHAFCESVATYSICMFDRDINRWVVKQEVNFDSSSYYRQMFIDVDDSVHVATSTGLFQRAEMSSHFIPYFAHYGPAGYAIDVASQDGSVVLRQNGSAHISRDSGKSWENLLLRIPNTSWWYGGKIAGQRILAVVRRPSVDFGLDSVDLVESNDLGRTWAVVSGAQLNERQLLPSAAIVYFDETGQFVLQTTGRTGAPPTLYRERADTPVIGVKLVCGSGGATVKAGSIWCAVGDELRSLEISTGTSSSTNLRGSGFFGHPDMVALAPSGTYFVQRQRESAPNENVSLRGTVGSTVTEISSAPIGSNVFSRGALFYARKFDNATRSALYYLSADDGKSWVSFPDFLATVPSVLGREPRPMADGSWWRDARDLHRFYPIRKTGELVEYQNTKDFPQSPGGQYFYTGDVGEQAFVDGGGAGNFVRTGRTIPTGGSRLTCRMYGSVSPGPNSHFYSADPGECDAVRLAEQFPQPANVPQWNYEGAGFFVVPKLASGSCPEGSKPVYRAYNRAFDANGKNPWNSNHRYSTVQSDIADVVTKHGWKDEGISFCSPAQ
jgi:hypothetical protein